MSEVTSNQNLDAHYSKEAKVKRPTHPIAMPPNSLTKTHLFNDTDANNRLRAINKDIYLDSKKEENRHGRNFIKVFGAGILAILTYLGLKRIFK